MSKVFGKSVRISLRTKTYRRPNTMDNNYSDTNFSEHKMRVLIF